MSTRSEDKSSFIIFERRQTSPKHDNSYVINLDGKIKLQVKVKENIFLILGRDASLMAKVSLKQIRITPNNWVIHYKNTPLSTQLPSSSKTPVHLK